MIGYLLSALVSLLVAGADPTRLREYVAWGFGSFSGVTNDELRIMAPVVLVGAALSLTASKTLNALLLGELYAESMGVNVRRQRLLILFLVSALTAVVTAFCGPIAFIGVAAPHLARPLIGTSDHRALLAGECADRLDHGAGRLGGGPAPGSAACCPLNAVTALIGVPVVVWVLTRRARTEVIT